MLQDTSIMWSLNQPFRMAIITMLADGKDVTPEGFDAKLAEYTAGTTWDRWQASRATCKAMFRVNITSVVCTIRLADFTATGLC